MCSTNASGQSVTLGPFPVPASGRSSSETTTVQCYRVQYCTVHVQGDQLKTRLDTNEFKMMVLNNRWELEQHTLTSSIMKREAKNFQKKFKNSKISTVMISNLNDVTVKKLFFVSEHVREMLHVSDTLDRSQIDSGLEVVYDS